MQWDARKLTERIRSIVTRGHLTRISKGQKHLKVHYQYWLDTDASQIPYIQNGAVFYWPKPSPDIEVITVDPEGDPSHRVAIALSYDECPDDVEEGDWIARPNEDNNIKITDDGICINSDGEELIQVLIDALTILNAPAIANGALTPTLVKLNNMKC